MSDLIRSIEYQTEIAPGGHWSLRLRRGTVMRLTDLQGDANLGLLMFNPDNLLERYNAPDTLKCQHTFRLTRGNCLYSDMGRVFASIIDDELGWHESVCGNSHAELVNERWGQRDFQNDRNAWHQNGHDAFLVEMAKYGLDLADLPANVNLFNKVVVDDDGQLSRVSGHSQAGNSVTLRFEMDTLVLLHTCPHPLDTAKDYPARPVKVELGIAEPVAEDDECRNFCEQNQRGFRNNALYHLGPMSEAI
ncbi:urea carboxylase [Saccharospirillum sp. MSK14-1]|uniref:urea amidolyase associated protein UAAP1 n=1 Tax=Saccharospirillum sp. MSK14-1 TaxID=1897632 RepID=UPI000D3C401D|nr:urea amidolyase associated protein UAAP1 [Saccharospirillum sp. MSK14-1]PTY37642.1 urea carboxylase [Saccharospirillum sp. MSK14-1]